MRKKMTNEIKKYKEEKEKYSLLRELQILSKNVKNIKN